MHRRTLHVSQTASRPPLDLTRSNVQHITVPPGHSVILQLSPDRDIPTVSVMSAPSGDITKATPVVQDGLLRNYNGLVVEVSATEDGPVVTPLGLAPHDPPEL